MLMYHADTALSEFNCYSSGEVRTGNEIARIISGTVQSGLVQ